jgi:hypothetical protein
MWPCRMLRVLLSAFLLIFCSAARAQDESTSKPEAQNPQERKDDPALAGNSQQGMEKSAVSPTPGYPVDAQIHAPGRAMPWLGRAPLSYGPFGIRSFDAFAVYDQFYPNAGGPSIIQRLEVIRMGLSFDKTFKKTHFLLAYTPQLIVLNDSARGSAVGDNAVTFGTTFELSPRFSLTLKDDFSQFRSRKVFPDKMLEIDRETGGVTQQYFLENDGTYTQNRFQAIFNYKFTPRWVMTVAPAYTYARTDTPKDLYVVNDWPNAFGLTYALSPRRNIGLLETIEILAPIHPVSTKGVFYSSGFFYSEQLSQTWWITAKLGAEEATYPGFHTANWGVDGSFTLLKTFGLSDVAANYYRGSTLTNFLNDRQTDRADLGYGLAITKTLKWNNEIGYFRTVGGDPQTIGKYGLSSIAYRLPAGFSIFASYSRRAQRSSTAQLISGDRNTFLVGFHWDPATALQGR